MGRGPQLSASLPHENRPERGLQKLAERAFAKRQVESSKLSVNNQFSMRSLTILLSLSALFVSGFAAPVAKPPDWHHPIKPPGHVNGRGILSVASVAVSLPYVKGKSELLVELDLGL
jgi:hypothetical protein